MTKFWRSAARVVVGFVIAYLLVVVFMMFREESFLYFPDKYPEGDWHPAGLEFEDAWFDAADGTHLHGWYVPCEKPRAVALFAHGNAGNLSHRADLLVRLQQMGVAVLAFDYRGYGRSAGSPTEAGVIADGARRGLGWQKEQGFQRARLC